MSAFGGGAVAFGLGAQWVHQHRLRPLDLSGDGLDNDFDLAVDEFDYGRDVTLTRGQIDRAHAALPEELAEAIAA